MFKENVESNVLENGSRYERAEEFSRARKIYENLFNPNINKEGRLNEIKEEKNFYSTYEERLAHTPAKNGYYEGERGESKFHSFNEDANSVLKEYGKDGIEYKECIPDFSEVCQATVEIESMTANRIKNFVQADEKLAAERGCRPEEIKMWRDENDYTWHERNDMKTMDMMPSIINATFTHLGGVSECKKADMEIADQKEWMFDE